MDLIVFYLKGIIILLFGGSLTLLALAYLQSVYKRAGLRPLLEYLSITVQAVVFLVLVMIARELRSVTSVVYYPAGEPVAEVMLCMNRFNVPLLALLVFFLVFIKVYAVTARGTALPALLCVAGALGAGLAGDALNVYIYYELFILASFYISYREGDRRVARYAPLQVAGSFIFLFALVLMFHYVGSFQLARLLKTMTVSVPLPLSGLFLFLVLGLAAKGGVAPFPDRGGDEGRSLSLLRLARSLFSLFLLCRLALPFSRLPGRAGFVLVVWGLLVLGLSLWQTWRRSSLVPRLVAATPGLFGYVLIALGMGLKYEYSSLAFYTAMIRLFALGVVVPFGLAVVMGTETGREKGSGFTWEEKLVCFALSLAVIGVPPLESFWGKYSLAEGLIGLPHCAFFLSLFVLTSLLFAAALLPASYRLLSAAGSPRWGKAAGMSRWGQRLGATVFLVLLVLLSLSAWLGGGMVGWGAEYIVEHFEILIGSL